MKPDHITSTVNYIRNMFKSYNLDYTLNIEFLEDDYDSLYTVEQIAGTMLGYFTFLAILISYHGLIGLSTFVTVRRPKKGIGSTRTMAIEILFHLVKRIYCIVALSFILAMSPC